MRGTDDLSPSSAQTRLHGQVDRLRRWVMSRRPVVRWLTAALAIAGLTSLVYWAATNFSTVGGARYLVSGRKFSSDDLIKVCTALDKDRVNYRVDESRRIEVAADDFEQAAGVVAKLEIGQRPIGDIREQSYLTHFLDSSSERESRKQLADEKIIEGLIGRLDGVAWSLVSIDRPASPRWARVSSKPKAFVYIETEGNRQLPYQTAQLIPIILTGRVSDLTPGSITVMDRRGNRYFDAGNRTVADASRDRAREEDLAKDIMDKLDWIKGVRVQVKVIHQAHPLAPAGIAATAVHQPVAVSPINISRTGIDARPPDAESASPAMRVNQALLPEPAAEPVPPAAATLIAARATNTNPPEIHHSDAIAQPLAEGRGRVLVYVPRSFYLNADIRPDNREPAPEELRLMAERTESQIKTAVSLVTPSAEAWSVDVFTIPDELSMSRPVNLQLAVDARRKVLDWGIIGTVVAAISILAALGSWIQLARRPPTVPEPVYESRRFHVDTASEPGPSERVRELVRRNPEAAASVLERWTTGQGGRV